MTIDARFNVGALAILFSPFALTAFAKGDAPKIIPSQSDSRELMREYVKYAHAFNKKNSSAHRQALTPAPSDSQELMRQYAMYGYAFNKKDLTALRQMLTPDCQLDVSGVKHQPLSYLREEMAHYAIDFQITKAVIRGATATVLVQELEWHIEDSRMLDTRARQDYWVKTGSGWRISHIHTTDVVFSAIL